MIILFLLISKRFDSISLKKNISWIRYNDENEEIHSYQRILIEDLEKIEIG